MPISRLAESTDITIQELARSTIPYTIVGHVGDGNYHVILLIDPHNSQEIAEMERINQGIVQRAITMDGSCTGEYAVGVHKMPFLVDEHGEDALDTMRALKNVLLTLKIF